MPITDLFIVSVIIFAFILFAVVLAWGDHQTREIARASRELALTGAGVASLDRGAGADDVERNAGKESKVPAPA